MSDDYIDWEKAARKYNIEIGEKDATIARLTQELEEARRWVNDLQSGMYINCVYCGHRYGPKDKVPCTMADALKQHIEQCPKHPMSSLRAELADLKDGLTAAHMDGFASGKAEATEMLRKREGQLEELRAEVKAYREVEDSLQKEIKRLDKEVASLTQELEEARSMIQWERGAKNGAYELIEQQDKLKAENAALREEAALYQKEWAILRAEVERFRAENAQLKCNFAPILHFAKQ